jgi:hypothetical protein
MCVCSRDYHIAVDSYSQTENKNCEYETSVKKDIRISSRHHPGTYVSEIYGNVFAMYSVRNAVFWDVRLWGSCKKLSFGGRYHLLYQGDKNRRATNISSVQKRKHALLIFVARRFLSPWWWRIYVPPKRSFLLQPQDVTFQKTAFFIVTAVITSNLTYPL